MANLMEIISGMEMNSMDSNTSNFQNTNSSNRNKKHIKYIVLTDFLIVGINEGIFWIMKCFKHVEDTNQHHTMIISTSLIMVGFLLRATNMTVQARSNEKLKSLRDSKEWMIMETFILVGELLFLISGVWSTITMVYKLHGDLSYSFQISFFLSGVLYLLIVIISSRSAMKYL